MFTGKQLRKLLIPLMIEQVLGSLMGTADTMMVSSVGSAAISAVSLVDSINSLMLYIFTAVATGGAIICAQYLGRQDRREANEYGRQLIIAVTGVSLLITAVMLLTRVPLLKLIFGSVEDAVMENSLKYFMITAASYPFIALYNAGAALFRVDGNSRLPMVISMVSIVVNIACNAILIFVFHMGVVGAALATLLSRVICAVAVMCFIRQEKQSIVIRDYLSLRPDLKRIGKVMAVGIPTGIENGMFQFGKLAIQSTISTLGTTAIAAHAMAAVLEGLASKAPEGIAIGMVTVIGQAIGANRQDLARQYMKKLTWYAEIALIVSCAIMAAIVKPITVLGKMETESAALCCHMIYVIAVYKIFPWTLSYIPAYGLRAAGDVRYTMTASMITMWIGRVAFTLISIRVLHQGVMFVWYGMFMDWTLRAIVFSIRAKGDKWLRHRIVQ